MGDLGDISARNVGVVLGIIDQLMVNLPKTNIAPENTPSQKETSIPTIHFQV